MSLDDLTCPACGSGVSSPTLANARNSWRLCRKCLFHWNCTSRELLFESNRSAETYSWGVNLASYSEASYREDLARDAKIVSVGIFANILHNATSFLDIGSGTGSMIEAVGNKKISACGVEFDMNNSRFSRERGHSTVNVPIEEYSDQSQYDVVHMCNSFYYFKYPRLVLDKIYGILPDHGCLIWREKDYMLSPLDVTANLLASSQLQYLSKASIALLLASSGFKVKLYKRSLGSFFLVATKSDSRLNIRPVSKFQFLFHLFYLRNIVLIDLLMSPLALAQRLYVSLKRICLSFA